MFPNFSTFYLLFHQIQFDNNPNLHQLCDSPSPLSSSYENCSIVILLEFPKKKNYWFLSIYICNCSTSLLQIWKVPLKWRFFFFFSTSSFSPIFLRFFELILLVMYHWRSQVPTTFVPINQPKKSQSHGEEYIKRIAMSSYYYSLCGR